MNPSKHNPTSSGCFSGVFRCLLCSRTPQTYPSDQITDLKTTNSDDDSEKYTACNEVEVKLSSVHVASSSYSSSPGVVAKLMGLDSLPTSNLVPKRNNADVVTRSRSVNFIDYLLQFDPEDNHHRRVRTSVSFREVPPSTSQRNHDLLVLFVDGIGGKKPEMGCEEVIQRKPEKKVMVMNKEKKTERREKIKENPKKVLKFKNEPRRFPKGDKQNGDKRNGNGQSGVNPMEKKKKKTTPLMKQKEALTEKKVTQKRTAQIKVKETETEYFSSDHSSPVSVLDHEHDDHDRDKDEVFTHPESSFPEDSNSGGRTICKYPLNTIGRELRNSDQKHHEHVSADNTEAESYYSEVVTMLFRLTEEDTVKDSNWVFEKELNLEEICRESGEEIFNQILHEMVDELVRWI